MSTTLQNRTFAKPMRRLICAALAAAITALTTQTVIQSAGQHEYGLTAIPLSTTDLFAIQWSALHWSATNWSATQRAALHLAAADAGADTLRRISRA